MKWNIHFILHSTKLNYEMSILFYYFIFIFISSNHRWHKWAIIWEFGDLSISAIRLHLDVFFNGSVSPFVNFLLFLDLYKTMSSWTPPEERWTCLPNDVCFNVQTKIYSSLFYTYMENDTTYNFGNISKSFFLTWLDSKFLCEIHSCKRYNFNFSNIYFGHQIGC